MMDKRLKELLLSGKIKGGNLYLLDTYNQTVYDDVACTITTRINASNQHYVIEKVMKEVLPLNPDDSGLCRPLKAQYYKNGCANFLKSDGGSFAATGVIERDTPMKGNYTEQMIYDDYNSKFPQDQDVIGTITTQIGNPAPRHGFKIVESAEPLRIPQATKKAFIEVMPGSLFDMSYPESKKRRGRVQEGGTISPTLMASGEAPCYYEGTAKTLCLNSKVDGKQPSLEHRVYDSEGISTAMTTGFHPSIQESTSYRIRKLTPRECFRLMGVAESDIDKIQNSGVSQSQQYKMAGNSIVVDVLEHIFRKMFVDTNQESQQLSLF